MAFDKDALLAELTRLRDVVESAEAGEEGSEPEGIAPASSGENSTIKAIRAEAKRAEKRAAAAEAEAAELRKFKEEATLAARTSALAQAGLTPSQAQVFMKAYDEVTDETVQAFKSEVLGVREEAGDEGVPSAPFAPTGFSSEKPVETVNTREDIKAFVEKHGVEAATKAWQDGKLKFPNAQPPGL